MNIYFFNISALKNKTVFEKYYKMVSELRKEKIQNFKNPDDKLRSLGAGLLIHFVKYKYGIVEKVKIDRFGKPYFENSAIYFNLSHSGQYVVIAVSEEEVGIDIQKIVTEKPRIAEKNFLPKECAYINEPEEHKMQWQRFCEVWTLKEAYLKKTGIGLRKPLNSFEVDFSDNIPKIKGQDNLWIVQFILDKNYIVSACMDRGIQEVNIKEIRLGYDIE